MLVELLKIMVLHVVVDLFYSCVAFYLKARTLAANSVHKCIFLIPWTCFNGVFVIANSYFQVQLGSHYESGH